MFKKSFSNIQPKGDFRVSFIKKDVKGYYILVGPRFRPQLIPDYNCQIDASLNGNSFLDFYSPESTELSFFVYQYLAGKKKEKEISKYFPLTAFDENKLTDDGIYPAPTAANGGTFIVPAEIKTYFWMKMPSGYSDLRNDYTKLDTEWARLEFGATIPKNSPLKYDANGVLTYTIYIPIFSITPEGLDLNLEHYDCGAIRYFTDTYSVEQGGKPKSLPFDFSEVSSYEPPV